MVCYRLTLLHNRDIGDVTVLFTVDGRNSDKESLSNRQLAQRARRQCEQLGRPPSLPRFFPSLPPTCRQLAQIQRAGSKRAIHLDAIPEEIRELAVTDVSEPSSVNNMQSDIPEPPLMQFNVPGLSSVSRLQSDGVGPSSVFRDRKSVV